MAELQTIQYYLEFSHWILYEYHLAKILEEYHAEQPMERKRLCHKMKLYIFFKEHHTMRFEHSLYI